MTVTLAPSVRLIAVQAGGPCRVRFYRSLAQRDADRARLFSSVPSGDSCLADFKFDAAGEVWGNPQPVFSSSSTEFFVIVDGSASVTLTWEG